MQYHPTSFYAIIDQAGNIANITKNRVAAQEICKQNGLSNNHAKQLYLLDEYLEHPKQQKSSDAVYEVVGNMLVQPEIKPEEPKKEENEQSKIE